MGLEFVDSQSVRVKMLSDENNYSFVDGFYDLSSVDHFWFQWRFRAFQRQLRDTDISTQNARRVLDIGAGRGTLREQLEKVTNWTIDITDLDIKGLKQANRGRGETFFYDINQRKPDFANRYDAVILFDVLEHVADTRPFIESILYHLRAGGLLFINVPAMHGLFSRFDLVQGHFRRYYRHTLSSEFDQFPLEMIDVRYWGLSNVPLLYFRRLVLDYFSKGKTDEEIYRKGFTVPGKFVNSLLSLMMRLELSVISRPPFGSSLLAILQKGSN